MDIQLSVAIRGLIRGLATITKVTRSSNKIWYQLTQVHLENGR